MLYHTFTDTLVTFFSSIIFINLWFVYYIYVNNITAPQTNYNDVKLKKKINFYESINTYTIYLFIVWSALMNFIYISNWHVHTLFFDLLYFSNQTIVYFMMSLLILVILLYSSLSLVKQNIPFSYEYLLFIIIIILVSFLLISSTNLYFTIFMLELIALLIFAKFVVTRFFTVKNFVSTGSISTYLYKYSYGLFNSLFFQFWANFVSSIFLFFSLINAHYLLGTSNFFLLNFFLSIITMNLYITKIFIIFISISLIGGLFIKLGLAPYQFFKIETYKGIPLYAIVVYTTLYLIVYVYFFMYIFLTQLPTIRTFINEYIYIMLLISLLYLVSLLFDTKNLKAFLSYSTLITVTNVFVTILTT